MDQTQDKPGRPIAPDTFEVVLSQKVGEGGPALYTIRTRDHWPWFVVAFGICLLLSLEVIRAVAGPPAFGSEFWFGFMLFAVLAALVRDKTNAAKAHLSKFVYSHPEEEIAFVRLDDIGVQYGVPKLQQTQVTWVYFNRYDITGQTMRLFAGGMTMRIDLSRLDPSQHASLRAGLARVFTRPRVGLPLHIPHCMGCGYDLSGSPGPNCPECGRPFHKYNYRDARTSD